MAFAHCAVLVRWERYVALLLLKSRSTTFFRYVFQNRGVSFDHFSRHGSHYRPLYRGNEFEKKKKKEKKERKKGERKKRNKKKRKKLKLKRRLEGYVINWSYIPILFTRISTYDSTIKKIKTRSVIFFHLSKKRRVSNFTVNFFFNL